MSDSRFRAASALLLAAALILQGCDSGSGGSNVGNRTGVAPTARAQILNDAGTRAFREGAEVLLSGKASEDADGPLLAWSWQQTAGPEVRLIERNTHTVSFTAPNVDEATELTFRLAVEDTSQMTGTADIDVTVIPAQDADKFLSLDQRGARRDTFDRFKVVAALADGASTGSAPQPLTLSAVAYVVYPPRSESWLDCRVDTAEFSNGVPAQTASGCFVEPLEDLTPASLPGGGTGIESAWPADVVVTTPAGLTDEEIEALRISEWWNPRFTLPVPRLDAAEFNQRFVDSGERRRILDPHNAHKARIVMTFQLTAPNNQQDAMLVLTDAKDSPIELPPQSPTVFLPGSQKIIPNDGAGLPTGAVVPLESVLASIAGRESALTSEVYYRTVDPFGMRWTLNSWLHQAGFVDDEGRLLPDAIAGEGEFAHAVYLNNYDLGFGRDMYVRRDEFGNVYSFVVNYSTLEGAIRRVDPLVTVVMEYSPLYNANDPTEKFVKFFTYVDDGSGDSQRVSSMDFDGRGERFTPGNCIACHGGAKPPGVQELVFDGGCGDRTEAWCYTWPDANADGASIANGNLGATFLPWDLESFFFADNDPAIVEAPVPFDGVTLASDLTRDFGDYSRAAQEAQLKKLNQFALSTYCNVADDPGCATDAARRLVEHWYGGVDQDGNLIAASFDDSTAPEGWRNGEVVPAPTSEDPNATHVNPDQAEEIYHEVYAQHCRMCHTNIADETLRFDRHYKFCDLAPLIEQAIYERGVMPAARLTNDRFWVAHGSDRSAAEILADVLGIEPEDGRLEPRPRARIGGAPSSPARNDTVRLTGNDSLFAKSFDWSVQYEPVAELLGNTQVAGYQPTLIGASTSELSFAAARPGTYTVGLTINSGADAVEAAPVEFAVPNHAPQLTDIGLLLAEGGSRTLSVLDELNAACAEPGCPEVFGDAPYTLNVDVAGWNPAYGTLTLDDAETGTITLVADQPGPIAATIPFSVTDADQETTHAAIDVTIEALAEPVAVDDNRSMSAQTTLNPPGPRTLSIAVLGNDQVDATAAPIVVNAVTQPANGTVTQDGQNLVYRPDLGFLGADTFTYNVIDDHPISSNISNNATVTVTVNATSTFSGAVQNAFSQHGCFTACHGVLPTAPDWSEHSETEARVNPPASARSSLILTFPNALGHTGAPQPNWTEGNANFNAVLRWIEEGAPAN